MDKKIEETGCTDREVLRISFRQILSLADETGKVFPTEACAVLFGLSTKKEVILKKIVMVPNILKSPSKFKIDGKKLGRVVKANENGNLKLIGFYHSHPFSPVPSLEDLQYMKIWASGGKDYIWLIRSTLKYEGMEAYRIKDGQPERVTMYIYKEDKEP